MTNHEAAIKRVLAILDQPCYRTRERSTDELAMLAAILLADAAVIRGILESV